MIYATQLEAKVAAVNRANAEANRLQPIFAAALKGWVGKKILNQGDVLSEAVKKVIEPLKPPFVADGYKTPHVFHSCSAYRLAFEVKVCESAAGRDSSYQVASYHEASFSVGVIEKQILASIFNGQDTVTLRTDWSAEEVRALRKVAEEADNAKRAAESALYCFGRYDR